MFDIFFCIGYEIIYGNKGFIFFMGEIILKYYLFYESMVGVNMGWKIFMRFLF